MALSFVAAALLAAPGFALADAGPVWTRVKSVDGIEISKGVVPNDPVLAFRGEGVVEAPLAVVATAIFDTTRATEWIDSLKECRLEKWLGPSKYLEYDHVGAPPLISDRDFVSYVDLDVDPKQETVSFYYRNADDAGYPKVRSFVRGDLKSTTFHLKALSPNRTLVVGEVHVDPKGLLPAWLVNWVQSDWPQSTFEGLRRQVAKPDVKPNEYFVQALSR